MSESSPSTASLPSGYGQLCAMALALDEIGGRWSLLVLRDLARTPLRFTDLQAINPGLSPTLLTTRLRSLTDAGIIERRTMPGPARTSVYALTDDLREPIVTVLSAVADLGAHLLERNPPTESPVELLAEQMRLNSHYVMARGSDLHGYFVLDLMGWLNHIVIDGDGFRSSADPPADREPDATAHFFPPTTMMRIMGRTETVTGAEAAGLLSIDGDRSALVELLRLLSFSPSEPSDDQA